MLEHPTQNY